MKLFNWGTIRLVILFVGVIFLFAFSGNRNNNRKLTKSVVIFEGKNALFVQQKTVNKLLIENKRNASSIRKEDLDLSKLESTLDSHGLIENADVFVSVDGVLKAVVNQKIPVARVFDDQGSFYVDCKGSAMPLSENFTARVPLVSGLINKKISADLARIFCIISEDTFLKKNIIGIQIMPNRSLKMLNRNFSYVIDFGNSRNAALKFKKYKAFFQKAVLDSSLTKYKKIDLRFSQQIVCTK